MSKQHIPVALERCIELLTPAIEFSLSNHPTTYLIDATLGLGGHTRALLAKFPSLIVIGIDRDQSAIAIARENVAPFGDRLIIAHTTYDQIESILQDHGIEKVAGILFDLGVSSMQLDDGERGFAYSYDAPLDMRMDQSSGLTAYQILHTYDRNTLIRILRSYGEEKFAPRIVDNIIEARTAGLLNSTKDLAELVKNSIPAPARRTGGNPAKRTFQALRIEVNQELSILERAIPAALAALDIQGRLVVMAYQSLEDKIVKSALTAITESKTPRGLPMDLPDSAAKYALVMRGSITSDEAEIAINPRAQSMRLRAVERLAA
ncbi:MAG TPA: 16S rRNA (cytosine(1402)-N(4))-methyltransferase RsmH [Candidatus Nanopelagicaceae bacterium]